MVKTLGGECVNSPSHRCGRLQRGLASELVTSARDGRHESLGRRGTVALALGCLHRMRGGLAMQVWTSLVWGGAARSKV